MNEPIRYDLDMLFKEIDKYDFNKPFEVSLFIIENDNEVELRKRNESQEMNVNESSQINSINFQNSTENQTVVNNTDKPNSSPLLPEYNSNAGTKNYPHANLNTGMEGPVLPPHPSMNSRPTTLQNDLSSNRREANTQLNINSSELDMLSMNIINFLKAFGYYNNLLIYAKNELVKKKVYEKYLHAKGDYFRASRDILIRTILPQEKKFNAVHFFYKTADIANYHQKFYCTFKQVEAVYNDIKNSCYTGHKSLPIYQAATQTVYSEPNSILEQTHRLSKITQTMTTEVNSTLQKHSQKKLQNRPGLTQNYPNNQTSSTVTQTMAKELNNTLQERLQNNGHNNMTQRIHNGPNSILQQNYQNEQHFNSITPTMAKGLNSTFQEYLQSNIQYKNVTPRIHDESNSVLEQINQNGQYSNSITQTKANRSNSTFQRHSQDESQRIHTGPNLILQQNNQSVHHCNSMTQTIANGPKSAFQGHLKNNVTQTINNKHNSLLQQDADNSLHSCNISETVRNGSISSLKKTLQTDVHYNYILQTTNARCDLIVQPLPKNINSSNLSQNTNVGQEQNSSDQSTLDPTTCVFQYKSSICPDYEVRLDVNTDILKDINKQSQFNIYSHIEDDRNGTKNQHSLDNVRKPMQSIESLDAPANKIPRTEDASHISQEPTRSTSRDSGFMSPCNIQIGDLSNNGEGKDPASPYITHVTSLNPEAVHIPLGTCHVCGKLTKTKCIGCFKCYYCSNDCQTQNWSIHQFECTNRS